MRTSRTSARASTAAEREERPYASSAASDGRRRSSLSGTASRAPSTAAGAGKRKKPGGHRRTENNKRAFPAVPAIAGIATLVVAASGALTLNSGLLPTAGAAGALAAGAPLTLGQLQDERAASADRADRSGREATVDPVADARARAEERAAERERAAWEAQHNRELKSVREKAAGATDEQTFKRVIQWVLPLQSFKLSSGFGQPGVLWANDHTGQDFSAPMGTPIRAVGAGEIVYAGYDGAYGNKIILQHDDGTETWYCHMSGFEYTGGYVRPGTTIGYVGSTGNSTGPHLHLEVHPGGGDAIDPLPWLRDLGLDI